MAEFGFNVTPPLDQIGFFITRAVSEQIPFATSQALNTLAFEGRRFEIEKDMPSAFHIRRPWILRGWRIQKANKKQGMDRMYAVLGHLDPMLIHHIVGIKRKPHRAPDFAMPIYDNITKVKARPRKARKPRGKKKPFRVRFKSGKEAIVKRTTKRRTPLQIVKLIKPTAQIDPSWDVQGSLETLVQARYPHVFDSALGRAISTAK